MQVLFATIRLWAISCASVAENSRGDDMTTSDIKSMQLYPRPERILDDLTARGYGPGTSVPVSELSQLDQLHYHGTDALDVAITECGIGDMDQVLEVGSGWGGCARYIADQTNAHVTAIELQEDYNNVARDLTQRTGLEACLTHVNADFLQVDLPESGFDHVVSWLALFHIPNRPRYLNRISRTLKPGGNFFAEDLYLIQSPPAEELDDFRRHLFPNSLINLTEYQSTLADARFTLADLSDMTADWTGFTATRLAAFREHRRSYEAIHGTGAYEVIHTFYDKMAGYFARGLVGGVRFRAILDG